jgi:hypothetical protein
VNQRLWIAVLALSAGTFASARAASLVAAELRAEAQIDPLAIQTAQPRLSWLLRPVLAGETGKAQSAYRILVASSSITLAKNRGDLWDTGKVLSADTIEIPYSGKPLASATLYLWKVQVWDEKGVPSGWSTPAHFGTGLDPADWKGKWIAAQLDGATPDLHMPLVRRAVRLDAAPASAIAYISGVGQYELSINGHKIGNRELSPGWTNFRKTVLYNAYDVTAALRAGRNAIGIMLGNGFYNVFKAPNRYTKLVGTFGQPQVIVQIRVTGANGKTTDIVTDSSWKIHPGPITFSQEFGGEDYDARQEPAGWNQAGFDDGGWSAALTVAGPGGKLAAEQNPPVEVAHVYRPVKVTEPKPGVQVYDLGQNFSGWPQITVTGEAGATVKLIGGELLDDQGLVSQATFHGPQWFGYTLAGRGTAETWHPRFSYLGFRYVQVEITGKATVTALEGQFLHAAAPVIGEFSCSKELFNRIHRLIDAAILSNMQSVLTDCPHREKLGWLEQSHLSGSGIMYNYDVETLYEKISNDMGDTQTADGLAPDIAPEYVVFPGGFRDSPEWGSAMVLDPWLAYRHFGDRRNMAAHYDEIKRYIAYLAGKGTNGILSFGLGDWYDIGPRPPGVAQLTGLDVTATGTYYQDLITAARIANVLGKTAEAAEFEATARKVRDAFQAKLYNPQTGDYDRGSQTANAMPLALGMVPEADRARVLNRLAEDIRAHRNHTTAGDIGFHYVIQALSEGGRSDVIYDLLANPDAPSYASQLARGATSLTEAWDASPYHSQNHFMLGHAEEWFYRYLAGIDVDLSRAADERIVLRPTPVGDVISCDATLHSVLGAIVSRWKVANGRLVYDVEIPPNTKAKVLLPAGAQEIGSGSHHFDVPYSGRR